MSSIADAIQAKCLGFGDRDLFGPFWTFWDFFGPSAVSRGEKEAKIVVVSVD